MPAGHGADVGRRVGGAGRRQVQVAQRARNLKGHGLDEGVSTRLLVYAGSLIARGIEARAACSMTLVRPLTDDPDLRETLEAAVATFFG